MPSVTFEEHEVDAEHCKTEGSTRWKNGEETDHKSWNYDKNFSCSIGAVNFACRAERIFFCTGHPDRYAG